MGWPDGALEDANRAMALGKGMPSADRVRLAATQAIKSRTVSPAATTGTSGASQQPKK
jgi:hypothetical protein